MADATKELSIIISAKDEATRTIEGIGASFNNLVNSAKTGSFIFAGALGFVGKSIIDVGSDMEQAKVAFTTFEGSAAAASKTLKELSDFAKVTPFTFPTITEAAKRLMAYGVEANDLIPTLKNLGDISAGVGTDKLPQLILAFGQVKARTQLAGQELRQFTEAGVPLLDALANQLNKTGGAMVKVGTSTKGTKADISELNDKLAIAKQRLTEATASAKTKKSTLMSLTNTVQNYEQKLSKASETTGGFSKQTKVTAKDVQDMISGGQISFDMVQKALESMTDKGGRFFNLMDKQSQTFSGRMSNISDQLVRVALNIVGISTNAQDFGSIVKGGAFDLLSQAAQKVLDVLNALEPHVKSLMNMFLKNKVMVGILVGALVGGLLPALLAVAGVFGPLLLLMGIFASLGAAVMLLKDDVINAFRLITQEIEKLPLGGYINNFIGYLSSFKERFYQAFKLDPSKTGLKGFFDQLWVQIQPGLNNIIAQIQQGFTNALNINFGKGGNIGDFFGRLMAIIMPLADLFFRLLTPAIESFKKSIADSAPIFDKLLQQLGPALINSIQILVGALAILLVVFLGLMSGLVQAVAAAIPYITQMFLGLSEFFNGLMNIIVGIFTLNLDQIFQGFKQTFQGIYDLTVGFVGSMIAAVWGFVKGIISFFQNLYDVLIGHSIIPDLVNGMLHWFQLLKSGIGSIMEDIVKNITGKFTGLVSSATDWGKSIISNMISGIKNAVNSAGKLGNKLLGELGVTAKELMSFQHGGFVPGSYGQAVPAMLHGGERVVPRNGTDVNPSTNNSNVTINISGSFNLDSQDRVNQLADRVISILGRQNELAGKGISF